MLLAHLFFAILVAVVFTAILLAIGCGGYERGGWATALILFGILLLTSWAGGIWLHPVGPTVWGAAWMPFFVVGFVVALLVAAVAPSRHPRTRLAAEEAAEAKEVVGTTISAFLAILAVCLIAAITLHYAYVDEQRLAGERRGEANTAQRDVGQPVR